MTRPPLSVRQGHKTSVAHDGPHDGVPDWLSAPLEVWVRGCFGDHGVGGPSFGSLRKITRVASAVRIPFALPATTPRDALNGLIARCVDDDQVFLDVVDELLSDSDDYYQSELMEILSGAGSNLTVGEDAQGRGWLEERVPEATRAAFVDAISSGSAAAHSLGKSWSAAFGRNKNPKSAYSEAIVAVEAAMRPVVSPRDNSATLGRMIGQIKDAPNKFGFRIVPDRPSGTPVDPMEMLVAMAQVLWQGYEGRHGESGDGPGPENTIEQAQDAVHLAVTMVQWSESGALYLR